MAYWDPVRFPTVSAFAKLDARDRAVVVRMCTEKGVALALAILDCLKPERLREE